LLGDSRYGAGNAHETGKKKAVFVHGGEGGALTPGITRGSLLLVRGSVALEEERTYLGRPEGGGCGFSRDLNRLRGKNGLQEELLRDRGGGLESTWGRKRAIPARALLEGKYKLAKLWRRKKEIGFNRPSERRGRPLRTEREGLPDRFFYDGGTGEIRLFGPSD